MIENTSDYKISESGKREAFCQSCGRKLETVFIQFDGTKSLLLAFLICFAQF